MIIEATQHFKFLKFKPDVFAFHFDILYAYDKGFPLLLLSSKRNETIYSLA